MICEHCKKKAKIGKKWWIHEDTNDTWCDPLGSQFALEYTTINPVLEEEENQ